MGQKPPIDYGRFRRLYAAENTLDRQLQGEPGREQSRRNRQQELSNLQHRNILTASRDNGKVCKRAFITGRNNTRSRSHWTIPPPTREGDQHICSILGYSRRLSCLESFFESHGPKQTDRSIPFRFPKLSLIGFLLTAPLAAYAQGSPFDAGFNSLQTLFTGTVAKVGSLIAIVISGYGFAHGKPGAKKALAGVAAGTGIAVLAANVLSWLWGV